jgi:hypothetical protein
MYEGFRHIQQTVNPVLTGFLSGSGFDVSLIRFHQNDYNAVKSQTVTGDGLEPDQTAVMFNDRELGHYQ